MSGVLKSVGKVFKKVVNVLNPLALVGTVVGGKTGKIIKKIGMGAMMVGAVVLTGGAALGALPAIGTVLGSVGISGTLASVLGGAISMGAIGTVTGGLGAAIQGKSVWKGATGGFAAGAVTGGVLGGLGVISPDGVLSNMGIGAKSATPNGLLGTASPAAVPGAAPPVPGAANMSANMASLSKTVAGLPGAAGNAVATTASTMGGGLIPAPALTLQGAAPTIAGAPSIAATAGAAAAKGGGLLSSAMAPSLISGVGSIMSGFAEGSMMGKKLGEEAAQRQLDYDRSAYNYGYQNLYGKDKKGRTVGGLPIGQQRIYDYTPQVLAQPDPAGLLAAYQRPPSPVYQIVGGQVVSTQPTFA